MHASPSIQSYGCVYMHPYPHPSSKHPDGTCISVGLWPGLMGAPGLYWSTETHSDVQVGRTEKIQWQSGGKRTTSCWFFLVVRSEKHPWCALSTWNCCHLPDDFSHDSRDVWWLLGSTSSRWCSGLLNRDCPSPKLPGDMDLGAGKSDKFT